MPPEALSSHFGPAVMLPPGDKGGIALFWWLSDQTLHLIRSKEGRVANGATVWTDRESVFDLATGREIPAPFPRELRQNGPTFPATFSPDGQYVLWVDAVRQMGFCARRNRLSERYTWPQRQRADACAWHSSGTGWSVLSYNDRNGSHVATYRLVESQRGWSARVERTARLLHSSVRPPIYSQDITDIGVFGDPYVAHWDVEPFRGTTFDYERWELRKDGLASRRAHRLPLGPIAPEALLSHAYSPQGTEVALYIAPKSRGDRTGGRRDDAYELWLLDLTHMGPQQTGRYTCLARLRCEHTAGIGRVRWNPGGTRLAAVHDGRLYIFPISRDLKGR